MKTPEMSKSFGTKHFMVFKCHIKSKISLILHDFFIGALGEKVNLKFRHNSNFYTVQGPKEPGEEPRKIP